LDIHLGLTLITGSRGKIGNEIGGTPALQLPDDKGRRRGGENPAGGARGGWRCEGGRDIFLLRSQEPGGLNVFNFATAFSLATRTICSVKQALAADS